MSHTIWEDPPPVKRGGRPSVWRDRLTPLMERPGVWARVLDTSDTKARNAARNLRHNRYLPPGRWQFTHRLDGNGTGFVYARYLGPEEE